MASKWFQVEKGGILFIHEGEKKGPPSVYIKALVSFDFRCFRVLQKIPENISHDLSYIERWLPAQLASFEDAMCGTDLSLYKVTLLGDGFEGYLLHLGVDPSNEKEYVSASGALPSHFIARKEMDIRAYLEYSENHFCEYKDEPTETLFSLFLNTYSH